ncbi:MAG: DEAD/DEAH box helicase [Kofleriaceae bacterium]
MDRGQAPSVSQLRDAIRAATSERTWSQGITLARGDRVHGVSRDADELELEVRPPGRATPFTVHLAVTHGEWECDCTSREGACSHVVAAVLAVAARADDAEALPTSRAVGGRLRYTLEPVGAGLAVRRAIVDVDGGVTALEGELAARVSGRVAGPPIATQQVDLLLDQLLGARAHAFTGERLDRLLGVLADAADVRLGDEPVVTSGEPVLPHAAIEDHGDGVRLTLVADPAVRAVVCLGVARCASTAEPPGLDVLRPIGADDLGGARLEHLPRHQDVAAAELPAFVAGPLPTLARRLPITVATRRLPAIGERVPPRIALDVDERGDRLAVMATLVYGDPPTARVDGGRLVHLEGALPVRDLDAERALVWRLRDRLNLVPGQRVTAEGKDVFALHARLADWLRADVGAGPTVAAVALTPEVVVDGASLSVRFAAGDQEVTPAAVLRAWQAKVDVVPLPGGGWGRLPAAWLAQHGERVADLLAARGDGARVPTFALPDLARLAADLDQPPPASSAAAAAAGQLRTPARGGPARPRRRVLRPYQRAGVDWLCFARELGLGSVLADDMGLGKTLQAIAAMRGRTLVVAPTSVRFGWHAELARFRPELRVSTYHGARRRLDPDADVVITTYPLLRIDADTLTEAAWDVVILDEAQAIKNPDSQVARAAYALRAGWRVSLSGTPVENRLEELWSQLHFTNPGLLGGRADFRDRWATPVADGDAGAAARLRERIRPFILRRLKRDVAPELPPRTEAVLTVELDEAERATYDAVRAATQRELVAMLEAGGGVMQALEALLRLRQAACHPALLPGGVPDGAPPSSKLERLLAALDEAVAGGHKALVFSQWTSLLDLVEPHLTERGLGFVRLDGQTRDRGAVVDEFQAADGPPVFLLSLKAGGTGLNLTAADHVFLLDPWWNPAVEDQAADRAHRIGQDKPVMIYRLVAKDTVEERILELQARKRGLADAALGEADRATSLTRDDLLALLA